MPLTFGSNQNSINLETQTVGFVSSPIRSGVPLLSSDRFDLNRDEATNLLFTKKGNDIRITKNE